MRRRLRSSPGCHSGRQVHRGHQGRPRPAAAEDTVQPSAVGSGALAQGEAVMEQLAAVLVREAAANNGGGIQIGDLD